MLGLTPWVLLREGFALRDLARAADLERRYPARGRHWHVYPARYVASAALR